MGSDGVLSSSQFDGVSSNSDCLQFMSGIITGVFFKAPLHAYASCMYASQDGFY